MKRAFVGTVLAVVAMAFGACAVETAPETSGTGGVVVDVAGGAGGGGGGETGTTAGVGAGPGGTNVGKRAGGDGTQDPAGEANGDTDPKAVPSCGQGHKPIPFYFSSDDSNSMASPVLAREYLTTAQAPDPARIRTYEFLNYYNALYPMPPAVADPGDGVLGVYAEMVPIETSPTDPIDKFRLQVGVQAFQLLERPPMVITFVIDTSGSLVGAGIERARAALLALSGALHPGDIVNVVTWANEDNVLVEGYVAKGDATDDTQLAKAVEDLVPGGGSDLHAGLTAGYSLAEKHFDEAKLNRVVLVSDGGANLGLLDSNKIVEEAARANDEGIYLVGIGVGPKDGYSDDLMDRVTDAGRGAYVYLDDYQHPGGASEATALFTTRFDEIMGVAARDVQVEIDLPPALEVAKFYGEEYSQTLSEVDPQNLAPGDSMVYNEKLYVTSANELCAEDTVKVTVTWETPITHEKQASPPLTYSLSQLLAKEPSVQFRKANAVIAYAEALKTSDAQSLQEAYTLVSSEAMATGDPDLLEIASLIPLHPRYKP